MWGPPNFQQIFQGVFDDSDQRRDGGEAKTPLPPKYVQEEEGIEVGADRKSHEKENF